MSEFEEILHDVGGFGPTQRKIFVLVSLFEAPAAWAMFLPVFTHRTAPFACVEQNDTYVSSSLYTNGSNSTEEVIRSCLADDTPCSGMIFNSSYTSIVTDWGLVCKDVNIPKIILTIQMCGILLGACIFGQLADSYGRKISMFIAFALMLATMFLTAFSQNWQMYAGLRALVGFFFGGTMVINQVLPLEFVTRQWRIFCGCIGGWASGVMVLAGLAYAFPDWRHLTMVTSLSSLVLLFTWWHIPESPRWLVQKGRLAEAEKILTYISKGNGKTDIDFSKLRLMSRTEEKKLEESKKYSYTDLFRTWSMSRNTLIVTYTWFVCAVVYYGVSLNVGDLVGNRYLNVFLMGLVEMPGLIFVILVNRRLGRKVTLGVLMTFAGVSCFAILFLNQYGAGEYWSDVMTQVLALTGKCGISGGWAAAQVFSAEIFPTVVRNVGVGACSMSSRVGGIIFPQILMLSEVLTPLPYVVFGVLALVCAGLISLLPETLNKPLPDNLPPRSCYCCCYNRTLHLSEDGKLENGGHQMQENQSQESTNLSQNRSLIQSTMEPTKQAAENCDSQNTGELCLSKKDGSYEIEPSTENITLL